ncbi:hypothetical protein HanHA89_Chr09g0340781 [Helianthus annuus]|nr:hypothetical protein HanHA89_Chr09g0340781 [Helianthus annuus]
MWTYLHLCAHFAKTPRNRSSICSLLVRLAWRVWSAFSEWCNIPPLYLFEFKDILDFHKFMKRSKKEEKIIYGLALITSWYLWKERNDVVFNQKRCSPHDIIVELKYRSFAWVKNRFSCKYIRWPEWCKYPMYML